MSYLSLKFHSVFYGWWIAGAFFLIALLTGGLVILGFTAFFEPIAREFGWSYTQISLAASFRGVEMGLLAPLTGLLIDRWGPRRFVFTGIIIVAFGMVLLSGINSLGMYYASFAIIAIGISGTSPTVIMTTVAHWFRKRLGITTGIIGSGFAIGGLLVPLVVKLIDAFDWRTALFIQGIIILVVCLPLSLLIRHKPEQYGYLPDGEKNPATVPDQAPVQVETHDVNIGTKEALRSRTFWHIQLAMLLPFFATGTISLHIMPYLSSVGIPRATASLVAVGAPLASIAGRLGAGWLADRYNAKRVATGFLAVFCLGMLSLIYISSEVIWIVVPYVIFYGLGWGGSFTLRASLIREYFGRSNYGSIIGSMMGILALGGIAGPLFAGWVYDNLASYQIAWITFAILLFASIFIMATTPPFTPKANRLINNNLN